MHTKKPSVIDIYNKIIEAHKDDRHPFVPRPQQIDMITDCYSALRHGKVALLEARTGTGKSFVLLLAAAMHNYVSGERVTIATPQKNLQRQMLDEYTTYIKNIEYFKNISVVVLKGRTNYASIVELDRLTEQHEEDDEKAAAVTAFRAYVESCGGDLDIVETEHPELIPEFVTDVRDMALPFSNSTEANEKYYNDAKQAAREADIIITNHHLVLSQVTYPNMDLLPLDNLIIDEGHDFINNAYSFMRKTIAYRTVRLSFDRLQKAAQGLPSFPGKKTVVTEMGTGKQIIEMMSTALTNDIGRKTQSGIFYIKECGSLSTARGELYNKVKDVVKNTIRTIDAAAKTLERYKKHYDDAMMNEYAKFKDNRDILKSFESAAFNENGDKDSYYLVLFSKELAYPSLAKVVPEISWHLYRFLWKNIRSLIVTSGTLADISSAYTKKTTNRLNASFNHFKYETGLGRRKDIGYIEYAYTKPFSWDKVNVYLYPSAPPFKANGISLTEARKNLVDYASARIVKSVNDDKPPVIGGALVLLTAYEDLSLLADQLELLDIDRRLVAQSPSVSVEVCVTKLRQRPKKTILALVGGWQGIDLPGKFLTDLFMPRVPHTNPDDPQTTTRTLLLRRNYANVASKRGYTGGEYNKYVAKSSGNAYFGIRTEDFWRFRQGVGRLARKEGDSGNIHIFDSRLFDDSPNSTHSEYMKFIKKEFENIVLVD